VQRYVLGAKTLKGAPAHHETLAAKGFDERRSRRSSASSRRSRSVRLQQVDARRGLLPRRPKITDAQMSGRSFDLRRTIGFHQDEIEAPNDFCAAP